MIPQSNDRLPQPASLARRHFMGVVAAGAGRLSVIAVSTALLTSTSASAANSPPNGNAYGNSPDRAEPGPGRGLARGHNAQCFGCGTLIQTARGEVAVEDLKVGELVVTAKGAQPIKWIGRQTIKRNASAAWHPSVTPIRVSRFAIDDHTPRRDLYLSPNHCLLIDGVLIPVKHLVNESSIVVDDPARTAEAIVYFSVELDSHEVIYAEGAAAETFQYTGGQIGWDNLADYEYLYGAEHRLMEPAAPIYRYSGGRAEVGALLRLAASRFVDVRDPIQIAYSSIAARQIAA